MASVALAYDGVGPSGKARKTAMLYGKNAPLAFLTPVKWEIGSLQPAGA